MIPAGRAVPHHPITDQPVARTKLAARGWVVAFLVFGLSLITVSAYCRSWKATPEDDATYYSQIADSRTDKDGGRQLVMLWWLNPPSFKSTLTAAGEEILSKYLVIAVAHVHISASADITFDDIPELKPKSGSTSLKPLSADAIPLDVAQHLAAIEGRLRQGLGRVGQGVHFFVFEAGPQACEKGPGLAIPLGDETYTWETPIPGCPEKR